MSKKSAAIVVAVWTTGNRDSEVQVLYRTSFLKSMPKQRKITRLSRRNTTRLARMFLGRRPMNILIIRRWVLTTKSTLRFNTNYKHILKSSSFYETNGFYWILRTFESLTESCQKRLNFTGQEYVTKTSKISKKLSQTRCRRIVNLIDEPVNWQGVLYKEKWNRRRWVSSKANFTKPFFIKRNWFYQSDKFLSMKICFQNSNIWYVKWMRILISTWVSKWNIHISRRSDYFHRVTIFTEFLKEP